MTTRPTAARDVPPVWTEGVCGDGAALLRDGVPVRITELLRILNQHETLLRRVRRGVEYRLPTFDQCRVKVACGDASEIERFIHDNEPVDMDTEWRERFAAALAESVQEDRMACLPDGAP